MNVDHMCSSNQHQDRRTLRTNVWPVTFGLVLLSACSQAPQPPPVAVAETSNQATLNAVDAEAAQLPAQASAEPTIRRAARALAQKRLFEPAGDNALELYLQVIEDADVQAGAASGATDEGRLRRLSDSVGADPRTLAQQTLSDLFPYGLLWVKRAVEEQRFADAERVIGLLDRTQPGSASVRSLSDALASAQAQREVALASERSAAAQLDRTPAMAQPRTGSGSTPATPAAPRVVAATTAPDTSSSAPAPTQALSPNIAAALAESPTELAAAPAPRAPSATPSAAAALDLVLERQVTPRYPNRARRQRIEGWVEVSFMVQADGTVADPKVLDAEPRGVFDREALEAVRRWKYAPPGRNTDTSRRIEFRLNS